MKFIICLFASVARKKTYYKFHLRITSIIPANGFLSYSFTVVSRNGVYLQRLETRWSKESNGLLASASRVQKYNKTKLGYVTVREAFDPDFTEQEKSKIIWDISKLQTGIIKRRLQ